MRRPDRRGRRIDAGGCPAALATGLPSAMTATGEVLGAEDVAYIDGELYVGVDGGGAGHGNADNPSGIYHVTADGDGRTGRRPVGVDAGEPGRHRARRLRSRRRRLLDRRRAVVGHALRRRPEQRPDPQRHHRRHRHPCRRPVGSATSCPPAWPSTPTAASTSARSPRCRSPTARPQVLHVDTDGTVTVVWTGLTTVVDVAVGPDGTLYALELSTGNLPEPPFLTPMSGQIVRQTGPDTAEVVVGGLMLADRDGARRRRVLRVDAGHRRQRRQRQHRLASPAGPPARRTRRWAPRPPPRPRPPPPTRR